MRIKGLAIVCVMIALLPGCGKKFEPELKGWKAYTLPGRPMVHLDIDGHSKTITLPADPRVNYRFPQWTKSGDQILLTQVIKKQSCDDYQIVAVDTTGAIVDTVFVAPPLTPVNFKLAPNDTLLIIKTYDDKCDEESDNYKFTFYNRFSKKVVGDTIPVGNARGILLPETIWSPDSKKVLITEWSGSRVKAYAYDVTTKDTTYIGKGNNFVWSPADTNLVAYIKDYSIVGKNVKTAEEDIIYEGKRKRFVKAFRFSPDGTYLMMHVRSYLLNVEAGPTQQTTIYYYSLKDERDSRRYFDDQRIDTWR